MAHLLPVILQHKEIIYNYRGIWHHSVISREFRNDVFSSDYTDGMPSGVSLNIVFCQLIDTQQVLHTYLDWN